MNEYRITKYDPSLRDLSGAYVPAEWTCSDVGRSVSLEDDLATEDRYLEARAATSSSDLFIEPWASPYHREEEVGDES